MIICFTFPNSRHFQTRDILTSELRALSLTSSFAPTLLSNTSTPPPRVFHCTVQLNSTTLFVGFGSSPDGKALDDTWIYTLDRNEWKSLDPLASGVKPPAMSGPACSLDSSRNRLVIFGPGTADRNQVSFLDLATLNWTIANIPVPDPALLEPSLRWGSSCAVVVDWLVCWGGYLVKSDLFTYDVRPYFLSLVPTPQWQYAPTTLLTPTPSSSGSGLSVGAIVGIAISLAVGIATIVSAGVFLYQRRKLRQKVERGEVDLEELRRDEAGWK